MLHLDAKFSDSFYTDFFVVLFTAINGKQQGGVKSLIDLPLTANKSSKIEAQS